jgi:hypothetical protein
MTDLAQRQVTRPNRAIDQRSGSRPAGQRADGDSKRAAARAELGAALSGVELTPADRRFLARLSQWDKRTASTVASLVARARQRGRREAGLSAAQLELVLAALLDAVEYRTSGAASAGCWECASRASGLCAEHALDADQARRFTDLAVRLCGDAGVTGAGPRSARISAVRAMSLCGQDD